MQIQAIEKGKDLKIQQLKNYLNQLQSKLKAEQAELIAANNDYSFAQDQEEIDNGKRFKKDWSPKLNCSRESLLFKMLQLKKL